MKNPTRVGSDFGLASNPHVLHSGWLTKRGQFFKSWKKRFFVLLANRELQYFESDKLDEVALGKIDTTKAKIAHDRSDPKRPNLLSIQLDSGRVLLAFAQSQF